MDIEMLGLLVVPALAVIFYWLVDGVGDDLSEPGHREDRREAAEPISPLRDTAAPAWSPSLLLFAFAAVLGVAVMSFFSGHRD